MLLSGFSSGSRRCLAVLVMLLVACGRVPGTPTGTPSAIPTAAPKATPSAAPTIEPTKTPVIVPSVSCPTGGTDAAANDQTLRVMLSLDPPSLDPALADPTLGSEVVDQTVEPLLRPGPGLDDVRPAAAESYTISTDGLVYQFRIRSTARFSDGQPVTAKDFVYGWQRILDPRTGSDNAFLFADFLKGAPSVLLLSPDSDPTLLANALSAVGLRAVDDRTFEVTLSRPRSDFKWLATLAAGAPIEAAVVEKAKGAAWATRPETYVTNGPFMVTEIAPQDHYTLVPNPFYWNGKPRLQKLVLKVGLNPDDAVTQYLTGDLDIVSVPADKVATISASRSLSGDIVRTTSLTTDWLVFNASKPPFDNPKVREAFIRSVDRAAAVAEALQGLAVPLTSLLPPSVRGFSRGLGEAQGFDPLAARAALAASGVSPASFQGSRFVALDTSASRALAPFLQQQWKKNLGIDVSIELHDPATLTDIIDSHDFNAVGPSEWRPALPDPRDYAVAFTGDGPGNRGAYASAHYDELIQQANRAKTTDAEPLYVDAQRQLLADNAAIFLDAHQDLHLVKPYVKSYVASGVDGDFVGSTCSQTLYVGEH